MISYFVYAVLPSSPEKPIYCLSKITDKEEELLITDENLLVIAHMTANDMKAMEQENPHRPDKMEILTYPPYERVIIKDVLLGHEPMECFELNADEVIAFREMFKKAYE